MEQTKKGSGGKCKKAGRNRMSPSQRSRYDLKLARKKIRNVIEHNLPRLPRLRHCGRTMVKWLDQNGAFATREMHGVSHTLFACVVCGKRKWIAPVKDEIVAYFNDEQRWEEARRRLA